MPICLRLLVHLERAAASRTFWTAGSSNPMRIAMIAITTSSSMSVNAALRAVRVGMGTSAVGRTGNERRAATVAARENAGRVGEESTRLLARVGRSDEGIYGARRT